LPLQLPEKLAAKGAGEDP